ncbi:MAG: helix-turn-helix domain-containing protein [Phycisphaerae bacterium]|nr:helix-turn-helix domain-containing protein [Phycisphaerae bacterium]
MLTVHDVAGMLNCSTRTVYRLIDSGRMPRPVRLGALVRWPRVAIESWIALGCPRADGVTGERLPRKRTKTNSNLLALGSEEASCS